MPARSVCLVVLSLSEAGPGRFGGQISITDIYHTIPYHRLPSDIVPIRSWTWTPRRPGIRHRHLPYHSIPWVCYRRRNQWLRLALALFCLPLIWLARVVYPLVGAAERWGGWRRHAYPCVVLGYAVLRYGVGVGVGVNAHQWAPFCRAPCVADIKR